MRLKQEAADFVWAQNAGDHSWQRVIAVMTLTLLPLIALAVISQHLIMPSIMELGKEEKAARSVAIAFYLGGVFAIAVALLCLGTKLIHKRDPRSLLTFGNRFPVGRILMGFALYAVLFLIIRAITKPGAITNSIGDKGIETLAITALPLALAFVCQGGGEEVLMRSYLPQVLTRWFKRPLVALLIPAVIFAALHFIYGPNAFAFSGMFALFATAVVLMTGGVGEIAGAHAANNFLIAWLFSDLTEATKGDPSSLDWNVIAADVCIFAGFLGCLFGAHLWAARDTQKAPD